jgi:hypothetical protein
MLLNWKETLKDDTTDPALRERYKTFFKLSRQKVEKCLESFSRERS